LTALELKDFVTHDMSTFWWWKQTFYHQTEHHYSSDCSRGQMKVQQLSLVTLKIG